MGKSDSLPAYEAPPVVETVLGAQFRPLRLTTALAGWYWKSRLGDDWPTSIEVPGLEDAFERFGSERSWVPQHTLRFTQGQAPGRLQIFRKDNQRLLQIQNSRFIYNWKKAEDSPYPTYQTLLPEFNAELAKFEEFVRAEDLGELVHNQWEVVYVNHLPRGELWQTLEDLPQVFPNFRLLVSSLPADNFFGNWRSAIDHDERGRLHVDLRRAKTDADVEVIRLQITARGPVTENFSLYDGFDLGHETIVRAFTDMTSADAHRYWKRRS